MIWRHLRVMLLMAAVTILLTGLSCWQCLFDTDDLVADLVFSIGLGYGIWQANHLANFMADRQVSWSENPIRRFWYGLAGMFVFSLAVIFVVNWLYFVQIVEVVDTIFTQRVIRNMVFQMIITIAISAIIHGFNFFKSWRQQSERALALEREMALTRYASLKNQVNPHFLFNNLNSLSALVQQDPTKAQEFIQKLSKVYRYILDNQQEEVVPLATEWTFCESWLYLEQLRYGDALQLVVRMDPNVNRFVPPMALQLLLENALKHNSFDREHPLTVEVIADGEQLVVRNDLRARQEPAEGSGLGIQNLRDRYAYLTDRPLSVITDNTHFEVRLPLLELNG